MCSTSHGNSEPWSGYFGCSQCMVAGGPRSGMEASNRLLLLASVDSATVSTYLNFCAALMLALDNSCSNEGFVSSCQKLALSLFIVIQYSWEQYRTPWILLVEQYLYDNWLHQYLGQRGHGLL